MLAEVRIPLVLIDMLLELVLVVSINHALSLRAHANLLCKDASHVLMFNLILSGILYDSMFLVWLPTVTSTPALLYQVMSLLIHW